MTDRCASCGYPKSTHDLGSLRCHPATADKNGRRGTYRVPPPVDLALYPEIMAREARRRTEAIEAAKRPYEPELIPPPRIPARAPRVPAEFATSNRGMSAAKLGRHAVAAGWLAEPWYWQEHDGKEGCAVKLARGPLRAVALWSRAAAGAGGAAGWKTEYAYAWRTDLPDRFPVKITITDLERFLDDDPET